LSTSPHSLPQEEVVNDTISVDDLAEPLMLSKDVYLSPDYARAEGEKLWAKVWQHAGRVEEIPNVGDFITYDIGNESILMVRSAPDTIKAFYNVCSHRGRQLAETPEGSHSCSGKRKLFVCGYHGWRYDLDGKCAHIPDPDDWKCALTEDRTRLTEVKVDTWGGWIWINMDPRCESLRAYLEPAAGHLDQFELDKMRYRWRKWIVFDCNWKVAIEAFAESYHVKSTHPQLNKYGDFYTVSYAQGLHGNNKFHSKKPEENNTATATVSRAGKGADARKTIAQMQQEFWETMQASTTPTLVEAAQRLVDELPEGTPPEQVHRHWMESARKDDAARGLIWPDLDRQKVADAGLAWQIFPNMTILQGNVFALCYRTRPYGTDPNKCIYEAFAIERFPEGQEPKTEWVRACADDETEWRQVLSQDFSNMRAVQRGMQSRSFRGPLPNPNQERKVTNLHRNLARYMGTGSPRRTG
jgi:phenylpropionate dioxygenase-like ring-hydroxylating dioxygenase large terminal subunit